MRIPRVAIASLLVGALSAISLSGHAAPPESVAVIRLDPTDAPDSVASIITDALRRRAASTKGMRLVPGKDLVEIKLIFSCPDEAPSCMAQAAKSLGADKVVFGSVKRTADGYLVSLKLLNATTVVIEAWLAEPLPKKLATPSAVQGPVRKWFATLTNQVTSGVLRISSNVVGAAISIDGTTIANTGPQDVQITDVPPGSHEIKVEKPGYATFVQQVNLAAGDTTQVAVQLMASPATTATKVPDAAAPPMPPRGQVRPPVAEPVGKRPSRDGETTVYRAVFWLSMGATLVATGAAIKYGMEVSKINKDLDPYRRFSCTSSATGVCGADGKSAQPLTPEQVKYVVSGMNEGTKNETREWVFIGVAGGFGIASAYMLYKGYIADPPSSKSHAASGLRIFPAASANSGGIAATFDF